MPDSSRLKRFAALSARFLTVGAISTVIEIVAFNILAFGLGWDLVAAKITASLIALVNAYIGNRHWAFRGRDRRRRWVEIALFLAVNGVCTALGALLVWLGVGAVESITGSPAGPLSVNVVNLLSIGVVVLARFALYHWVVFPNRRVAADAEATAPSGTLAS